MSIDKITIGFLSLVGSKCLSTFFILKILLNTILGANFFCAHPIVTSGLGCVGLVSKKLCTLRSNRVLELRSNSSRKMRKTWYGSGLRGSRKNLNSHRSVEKSDELHECPKTNLTGLDISSGYPPDCYKYLKPFPDQEKGIMGTWPQ